MRVSRGSTARGRVVRSAVIWAAGHTSAAGEDKDMATAAKDIPRTSTTWATAARRAGMLLLALLPSLLHAQAYRSPLDNTVTVSPPADIADSALGNNTATDSNVLALQAQVSIAKVITSAVPVPAGGAVQYQITVSNQGPSIASGVTITDLLSAQLTSVSWTCTPSSAASSCAVASGNGNAVSVQADLGVNSGVVLLISAIAPLSAPATIPGNTASVALPPGVTDPTPGDTTATTPPIAVQPAALVATDDTFTTAIPNEGGSTPSVLGNDTLRGDNIAPGSVTVALQTAPGGFSIDAGGVVSVPAGAPAGRTQLTYQICETVSPQNCASAAVILVVAPAAVDDSFNVTSGSVALSGTLAANDRVPAGATYSLVGGAVPGLVINADGTFTYAPPGAITAPRTFTYQACLPAPDASVCANGTANILVDANVLVANDDVDLAPRTPGSAFTTAPVLLNDSFSNAPVPLDGAVQLSLIDAPAGFTIDLASGGTIGVPATAAPGRRVLTYQICETAFPANCATATMTLVVSPDAIDDAVSTPGAGLPLSGSVAGNDRVPAGVLYSLVADASRGEATVTPNGGFTYTPAAGTTGADAFSYRVCLPAPDAAVCDVATVDVLVGDNALDAVDDVLSAPVQPGSAGSASVLANDVFNGVAVAPAQVILSLDTAPAGYAITTDGTLQVPAGAVAGAQTLVYRLCESTAPTNCDTATVQMVVAPQATGEAFQATTGVLLEGTVAGNDNPLTGGVYSLLAGPAQGSATVAADGRITYLAPGGAVGPDAFQYQVCLPAPNSSVCATATATVTVQASVLLAVDDDFRGEVLTPAGGLTPSVLGNDTLNGQAVTAAGVSFVLTGAPPVGFFLEGGGELRIPAGASAGTLQLTYELCEAATRNCDSAGITLIIRPEAADDAFTTNVGREVAGNVAVNDNAPAGSTYVVVGTPPPGLQFAADGSFTYLPPAQLTGVTAFDYQVCLPGADAAVCATASARITVNAGTLAANDDDFRAAPLDPTTGGTTNSLLANDTYNGAIPPDPADMLLTLVGAPAGYSINANGTVSIPGGAAAGAVNFGYQMCERALPTNCASANVALLLVPVAVNDNYSTQAGVVLTGSVAANDNVPAGSTYVVTDASPAGLVFAADGRFVYTPPVGTQGPVDFTYRVCLPGADSGVCAAATVTLNVNAGTLAANDDDFRSTPIDAAAGGSTASVLGNDVLEGATPPAPAAVVLQLVGAPSGITLAADGTLTVAAGAPAGAVIVEYQLCEAALPSNCDSAQATVLVAPSAAADTFSTPAGQLFAGNVGANDNAPVGAVYSVQGALPAGLQFNPDGRLLYEPPAGFTGPVAFTYRVCLPAPDTTACSDAVATLNVNAGNVIALDDDLTSAPLAPGGSAVLSVLANDTLNAVSPPPPGAVTTTLVGAPAGYALDAGGRLQVGAQAAAGLQVLSYQLCEVAATGNCASALIRAVVTPQAVADAFTVPSGQTFNDAVGINDNAPADAVYTVASPPPGLLFSGNGSFSYTPQPGTVYPLTFTYQVCLAQPYSGECASADVTLTLSAGTLLATDDDFSATPLSPATGGRTASVLGNDSLNGVSPPAPASVLLTLTAPEAGVSIDADGSIVIAAGVAAGARVVGYQVCETALPSNCVVAAARIAVAPLAVADALSTRAGVTLTGNVGSNDTVAAGATFRITTAAPAGLTFTPDGSFTFVPPTGQTGAFGFSYEVCLPAPDATACSTAAVILNVNNGDLAALADDFSGLALAPGSTSPSVLSNDTLNAVTPAPATAVALSLIGAPAGYSIDATGAITVPTGVPSGRVTLAYQVCELAAPSNCATADVQLLLAPAPVNDLFSLQAGQALAGTVAGNDNVPLGSIFSLSGAPLAGLTLDAGGGFTYAPPVGTSGATSFSYQVCLPAPDSAVCASASVTFNVNNGTLVAVDDDFSAAPLAAGGSTTSVLGNDSLNAVTSPDPALVSLSLVNAPAGVSIAGDGVIVIATGAASGRTTLTYQVCEVAAPTNCDSATATLVITPSPQPDTVTVAAGGSVTGNVGGNDQVPTGAQFSVSGATPAGLQFNPDGSFTYAPPAATVGPVSFNYQVCLPAPDSTLCGATSVTLTISTSTLLAVADDFGTTPLAPGADTPSVLLNDRLNGAVPADAAVQLTLIGAPAGFVIRPDGTISTPSTLSGASTFDYQVCERASPSNCATATVRVVLLPQPVDDVVTTGVGVPVNGNVGSNDGVPAGAVFSVVGVVLPGLQFSADGSFSYAPPAGTSGAQAFAYQVCLPAPDGAACGTASVTLNVNLGTLAAVGDDFTTTPILAGGASGSSVLANDLLNGTTPPAGSVVISLVGAPAGYAVDTNGLVSVPSGATSGQVSFNYQLCETAAPGNCASAGVTLLVSPSPADDVVSTPAGTAVAGNVGSNDNVPPGATFGVPAGAPAGFQLLADGSFQYTPPAGTLGAQTVTYQVCLPAPFAATCGTATLVVNVNAGNLEAGDDDFRGTPLTAGTTTPSVLLNDRLDALTPPAAGSVIVTLVGAPGGVSIDGAGRISAAAGAASGALSLTYQVCETAAPTNCDTAVVAVVIAPSAVADSIAVGAGQTATGNVGSNDNAPAGALYSVVGPVPAGLQLATNGSFIYAPPAGATGALSFIYQVCLPAPDSTVCSSASVAVTVTSSALLAVADDFSGTPLQPGAVTPSVLLNDTLGSAPVDPSTVTVRLVGAPAGYVIGADGTVSTPAVAAAVTLTYEVCERAAPANCATASAIVVTRPAPVADTVSTPAGQAVTGNVGSNDGVPAGSVFSVQGGVPPGLLFNADGSFSYTPPAGVTGAVSFVYQVCLPAPYSAVCGTTRVTINVNTGSLVAIDDDFTAVPLAAGATSGLSVLANDVLDGAVPAPAAVQLSLVGATQGFAINPDGTLLAPAAGTAGVVTLDYQVCERAAPTNCANARVTVVRVPAPVADVVSTPAGQPVNGAVGSNDGVPPGASFSVVGPLPPGLQFNGDGSFTYLPPPGTTGPVTFTYQVCLPAPYAAVCGSAGVTVNVNTGNLVAADDDFRAVPLPTGGSTPSVLDNDLLDGAVPAPGSVVVTLPNAPAGITIDGNGVISVGAGAVRGAVTVTYQVCEAAAPGNCDSATVSLLLAPAPQPDVITVAAGATSSGNVGSNDDVPPGARFSVVGTPPPGLQFNPDGSYLYIPPAGTTGQIGFTYSVCLPAPDAAVCATASVTFLITTHVVLAVNDDFSATPVDPATGGTVSGSVLDNDTFNGVAPPPVGSVVAVLVNAPAGFTLTTQGQVTVAPGTAAGQYALTYQLCENGAPTNCSTAIATVQVAAPIALLAVDDSGGPVPAGRAAPNLLNVLANDTFNGGVLDPAQVTFAPVGTAELVFAADGSLSVPAGVGVGTWSTTYTLCLVSQPTVCDTATVSVVVEAGIDSVALQDDWVDLPPNGVLEIDVLANDRMDGAPIDPDSIVLTLISDPPYGTAEVMPRARIRFAARTWFAGVQTFDYAVCDRGDPTLCAEATVTIAVPTNTVTVADARMVSADGEPVVWDALANASSSTAPLDPASLQVVAAPANGAAECAAGLCTYTPEPAFAGTDSFQYQLCDVSVPTRVCDQGTIAVTVAGEQAVLRLTKVSAKRSVQIGDLVRYTVTVENVGEVDANGATLLDTLPPGFTFVQGGFAVQDADNSARPSGVQPLRIDGIDVAAGASATVVYYLRVGAGTGTGTHTNRITAVDGQDRSIGNVASADVEVTADPLLDESLVVGSVFDDRNGNGVQDAGERGIPGVRVAAVEGLLMETDAFGRYHLVGIQGGAARGRNFILKVDASTLPSGTRFTTPNPLVRRITPGLPARFDFGVVLPEGGLHAGGAVTAGPVEIELGEGLFVTGGTALVPDHGVVLEKAAAAVERARGGRLLLTASPQEDGRALQRAAVLAAALRTRLTPAVAAATRIDVVSGKDEQVLHNVRVDDPRGAGGPGEEGR